MSSEALCGHISYVPSVGPDRITVMGWMARLDTMLPEFLCDAIFRYSEPSGKHWFFLKCCRLQERYMVPKSCSLFVTLLA